MSITTLQRPTWVASHHGLLVVLAVAAALVMLAVFFLAIQGLGSAPALPSAPFADLGTDSCRDAVAGSAC